MERSLRCNKKTCRKILEKFAYVTSCSHIFCEEDGAKHFKKSHTCPACETVLGGKFAILKVDLELSEHNKAMALAGQNPVTIMEICTKALSFWMYQNHQERLYNEYIATRAKEKVTQMEQYYEQIISSTQAELRSLKNKVKVQTNEQEETKASLKDVTDRLFKKDLQFQKLETMYDQLKRIVISSRSCEDLGIYKDMRSPWTENYQLPVDQGEVVRVCDVPCPNISSRVTTPNMGRDAVMRSFSIPTPCGDGGMQMRKAFDIPIGPK
ncbi:hypothetical protein CHS0354_026720 [Potamilus streckersoni]|uniref:RING-type domain-containing protein n=1 Tax=Potamilus streckersoni TaxID=2493646 RepID=A0AAE0S7X7_9BIVA|nr:hypothetical protein CHS0354_026720 [Potamilus streckersoni]